MGIAGSGLNVTMLWMDIQEVEILIRKAQELLAKAADAREAILKEASVIGMEGEVLQLLDRIYDEHHIPSTADLQLSA